jgi:hypothetical protein
MQAETLYHTLYQKPFRPFRVYLKDGHCYDVRHQHLAMVGRSYLVIGIPIPEEKDPFICDHTVHLDLDAVDRVEMLGSTPTIVTG